MLLETFGADVRIAYDGAAGVEEEPAAETLAEVMIEGIVEANVPQLA